MQYLRGKLHKYAILVMTLGYNSFPYLLIVMDILESDLAIVTEIFMFSNSIIHIWELSPRT